MALTRFSRGLRVPFDGLGHVRQSPGLFVHVLLPALVNTAITLLALALFIALAWWWVGWVYEVYGSGFWQWVFRALAIVAALLVALGVTVVFWLLMYAVAAGYLLGRLAEKVERQLGLTDDQIDPVPLSREVVETARDTARVAVIHGGAFAAQFIPVVGTVIATPLALLADAYVVGAELMDYPMAVRGMTLDERTAFIRRHRPEAVGMGAVMLPLGLVPVVGGFVMAFSVIGSVLLYRELLEAEAEGVS